MKKAHPQNQHRLFCRQFENHVGSFIKKHRLVSPHKKISVAVSGGVDSMALAFVLKALGHEVSLVHFNHGTRKKENGEEESLVRKEALGLGATIDVFHFDFSLEETHFEEKARRERLGVYQSLIERGHWVYTAHHIDDSFEWSLRQSFRQGSLKASLGIPVFNRGLARPFMCVTKKQILRYARAKNISWKEDSSNQDEKFERNFLRKKITTPIYQRYPKALKHYVTRSNEMAMREGLHRLHATRSARDELEERQGESGVLLSSSQLSFHRERIIQWIHRFSTKKRGEIGAELDKLLRASSLMGEKGAFPFKGPMSFSGGVTLYLLRDHLFILSKEGQERYRQMDLALLNFFQEQRRTQIPYRSFFPNFPFLISEGRVKERNKEKEKEEEKKKGKKNRASFFRPSRYCHPLLPLTCLWLKENQIPYAFSPLLPEKEREKLLHTAVLLDSSVLGL